MDILESLANSIDNNDEELLQLELREMFVVDTEQHLATYFQLVERLNARSWSADVQSIYRAIHTIKGGAVTVSAEGMLQAAIVLEDLLDDLRSLKTAPELADQCLSDILTEAGELLASSMSIDEAGIIASTNNRLKELQAQVKAAYLPNWDKHKQLQQEFANQGFDLIILSLEMQLDALTPEEAVPTEARDTAIYTLDQLYQVGLQLNFDRGWSTLLDICQQVVNHVDSYVWKSTLPEYLLMLKECAINGGQLDCQLGNTTLPLANQVVANSNQNSRNNIQISVPLDRLDQSSQQAIETLLSTRTMVDIGLRFQSQVAHLKALVDENAQSIARLRQMQDDYAILQNLNPGNSDGNTLERYRQGYHTINRLLENILRTAELTQEIETLTVTGNNELVVLDRQMMQLRDGIESSRLVPFRTLTSRARAILRNLTNRYDKLAELEVGNEQIELDVGLVQQLEPVILHLIRNAYDHGIESIEHRIANGKLAIGCIRIFLNRQGHVYTIEIGDDGAGIDATKVSARAEAGNFDLTDTSSPEALLAVLCQPGFTSSQTINEISGRGVGMDVVASQVVAMGAKLSLRTLLGKGTIFSIELPATQLLVTCALLQVANQIVAIPLDRITETISLLGNVTKLGDDGWEIDRGEDRVWAINLAAYWQNVEDSLPDTAVGLGIKLPRESGWLIADDLLGQTELLVSPFPTPLVPPPGVLGISLSAEGKTIPVLDPVAVLDNWQANHLPELETVTLAKSSKPRIVIVDDAALIRRRLESSLQSQGFSTYSFANGLEALSWLQTNQLPSLMITDIEMPKMDGYALIDRCRRLGMEMPILVISSRLSPEWSKESLRLGANGYLSKGFSTMKLVETVESLLP
jgi:chemotaxis protein histidine kinase CheA